MTKFRLLLSSLVVLSAMALLPSESRAQWGGPEGIGNLCGFGVSGTLYGLGRVPVPPYFAIHPPVYYGHRYFRSYGESPYARPARSSRPFIVSAQLITNPFVPQPAASGAAAPQAAEQPAEGAAVASQPQMIINPYYEPADDLVRN